MSTSKMISQESLTRLLVKRGWKVINLRDEHNKSMKLCDVLDVDMRKGISLHGISPNGYVLSLQAGAPNYCDPRSFASEYKNLELAIWKSRRNGSSIGDGSFIRDSQIHGSSADDVVGWADIDRVMTAIKTIESWTEENGPKLEPQIQRPPVWDLSN